MAGAAEPASMPALRLGEALVASLAALAAWSAWPWWRETLEAWAGAPAAPWAPAIALVTFRLAQGALRAATAWMVAAPRT